MTFGAATSVLLTAMENVFAVWRYKKTLTLGRSHREREDKALGNVGFGASLRTRPTKLPTGAENAFAVRRYKKSVAVGSHAPLSNWYC